jgi:hypothetical protein
VVFQVASSDHLAVAVALPSAVEHLLAAEVLSLEGPEQLLVELAPRKAGPG